MDEILFIDKPKGITSFDVIRILRRKLGIRKMGHAGTLDPLATGLLIIAMDKATKQISNFMGMEKEYEVQVEFGKTSSTYDAEGELTPHPNGDGSSQGCPKITRGDFEKILPQFVGEIEQKPPIYSAIRIDGKRAYDLARKGEKIEMPSRKVSIESLEIIDWSWPRVSLKVRCSKGTYIRSLAHDLGQVLGCGGYVQELRRTAIGPYRVENAQKISPDQP